MHTLFSIKRAVPLLCVLASIGILAGLGVWQLQRKVWKEDLIAQIGAQVDKPAVGIPPEAVWPSWTTSDEYTHVHLQGAFRHQDEARVQALWSPLDANDAVLGFKILTPLELAEGSLVMVDRGFVPLEKGDPQTRQKGQVEGVVSINGWLQAPEKPGLFTPHPRPEHSEWFVRETGAIAQAKGLTRVAPFFVVADETPNPGGWPRGEKPRVDLPNNHLGYALTWFGLAGALVVVFISFVFGRRRLLAPEVL